MNPFTSQSKCLLKLAVLLFSTIAISGCATESHSIQATKSVASYKSNYSGPKYKMVVGKFNNNSRYMRGLFSDGVDRVGNQSKTILKTHLSQTNRFTLMDRSNMEEIRQEAKYAGSTQKITGAQIAITGTVTEFGRKEIGDTWFFGILGRGKKQVAYSKVSVNIVDVSTSEIVHSVQGAGVFELSNRHVLGFGGTSSYDSTLTAKVLNLSITDAVNKLVADLEAGLWSPSK